LTLSDAPSNWIPLQVSKLRERSQGPRAARTKGGRVMACTDSFVELRKVAVCKGRYAPTMIQVIRSVIGTFGTLGVWKSRNSWNSWNSSFGDLIYDWLASGDLIHGWSVKDVLFCVWFASGDPMYDLLVKDDLVCDCSVSGDLICDWSALENIFL
jgi:hypothetical protein